MIKKDQFNKDELEVIFDVLNVYDPDDISHVYPAMGHQQFKDDVANNGVSCVEGIDTVKTVDYKDARIAEYPSLAEQQDMQYWDSVNGTTIWKDKISEIKSKYPKSQVEVIEAVLPDWVADLAT